MLSAYYYHAAIVNTLEISGKVECLNNSRYKEELNDNFRYEKYNN